LKNPPTTTRRMVDVHGLAEILGIGHDSADKLLRDGKLRFIRLPGGRRRVLLSDIEAAIESWKVEKA
jgi:excisionase family DNA binding protein